MNTQPALAYPEENPQILRALIANIGEHYFGIGINEIQDVITRLETTPVPLASKNIIGVLNLRGHIVTEIDVGYTLGISQDSGIEKNTGYSIVINKNNEMYSLVFEGVDEFIDTPYQDLEPLPNHVNQRWKSISKGVHRSDDKLIVILDLFALIDSITPEKTE